MDKMKELFGSDCKTYDGKHINNTSKVVIDPSVIEGLERQGFTTEMLNALDVPVYRYSTQITIHGLFPVGYDSKRIGNYKNVFQNKNLSLGVRYNAIDREKKTRLFKLVRFIDKDWHVNDNSNDYSISMFRRLKGKTKEELLNEAQELVSESVKIREGLSPICYGSVGGSLMYDRWCGHYYYVTEVKIMSFLEENFDKVFHAICFNCNDSVEDVTKAYEEECKRKESEHEAMMARIEERYKREKAAADERWANELPEREKELESEGFVFFETFDCKGLTFTSAKIVRRNSDGSAVILKRNIEGKNSIHFETLETGRRLRRDGTMLQRVWVERTAAEQKREPRTEKLNIEILDYSDKCFKVVGDTKPMCAELRKIGVWNIKQKCWFVSKNREARLRELVG